MQFHRGELVRLRITDLVLIVTFAETLRSLRSKLDKRSEMQFTHDDCRLLRMIAFRVREEIDSSAGSKSRKPLTELG
jgi:hypothetical protein